MSTSPTARRKKRNSSLCPTRFWTALIAALILLLLGGCGSAKKPSEEDKALQALDVSDLKMSMLADIASIVFSDGELDGGVKSDIARLAITPLRKSEEIQIAGNDKVTRPVAVSFQKAFEQSLVNMVDEEQVSQATAIIHTRKPSTPLCNPPGKALPETLNLSMREDMKRRKTIEDRTITLRRMARQGPPMDLYVAYIRDGLQKRSSNEQEIYRREVNDEANTSLHDSPMTCTEMPDEIVGASYVITTKRGNTLYFGNNGIQAIDGSGSNLWRYWFGGLREAPVNERYKEVLKYLKECGLNIQL
ncbi:MAG: hypothetical protein ACR2PT_09935 [Endozoicomonas sp.]